MTANGNRPTRNTLVPRLAIFCSTYRFAPWTIVITVIRVATPMVRPRMVSTARSLCARMESTASASVSEAAVTSGNHFPPVFAHLDHHAGEWQWRRQVGYPGAVDFDRTGFDFTYRIVHRLGQSDAGQQ